MTITQTIKVPADRRITFEVPPQIPAGEIARFEIIWFPVRQTINSLDETLTEIQELCKDIPVSMNSLREERYRDMELEEAKWQKYSAGLGEVN